MVRFALYGQAAWPNIGAVLAFATIAFAVAARGYDPQRGVLGRAPRDET
jgi:ABC-2 type transport system permease protein